MKTLNWRHTDWNARNFVFQVGQEIIGQLSFYSVWNFNAVYTDSETKLKFAQKGFWSKILVTQEEKVVGKIDSGIFGRQTLTLSTGEVFRLSTDFWGSNVRWSNAAGEIVVNYKQATMSSMGKGVIDLRDTMNTEVETLLISAGLFIRQLTQKRRTLMVALMLPILAAASRR